MSYFGTRVASGGAGGGVSTADVDARILTISPTLSDEIQSVDATQDVAPTATHAVGKKVTKVLSDGTTEYWKSDGTTWTKTATASGGTGGGGMTVATSADIPAGAAENTFWLVLNDTGKPALWSMKPAPISAPAREGFLDGSDPITPATTVAEMTTRGFYQIQETLYFVSSSGAAPTTISQP